MFKVKINNLSIKTNIGITASERKTKQLLKVSLSFNYSVNKSKDLNAIKNLKDYSLITKYLKKLIITSNSHTLEHLITFTKMSLEKKFNIKNVKININKTHVAKKYNAESLSVSN